MEVCVREVRKRGSEGETRIRRRVYEGWIDRV
jgi:hypothetical protein